jgi:hypothetical protein
VLVLDAIGMGFFATSGAAIAVDEGGSWFAAGLIGMLTAIADGMLRDRSPRTLPRPAWPGWRSRRRRRGAPVMGPDDLARANWSCPTTS